MKRLKIHRDVFRMCTGCRRRARRSIVRLRRSRVRFTPPRAQRTCRVRITSEVIDQSPRTGPASRADDEPEEDAMSAYALAHLRTPTINDDTLQYIERIQATMDPYGG